MAAKKKAKKPVAKKAAKVKPAPKKTAPKKAAAPAKKSSAKAVVKKTPGKKTSTPKTIDWNAHITPLEDRLVVQAEGPSTMTAGGIIIPDSASDRPFRGQVLAKGRGRRNKKGVLRPLDVNVGDQVMFAEWAGTKLTVEGREVLILREEEILGIVLK